MFLRVNPFLEETLRTKGRRGANLWVTIYDEKIPPMTHLKDASGEPIGEWRSDRSYTLIAGKHPNGMSYETVVAAKPLEIAFEEIKWPDGWGNLPTLPQEKPKPRTVTKVEREITTKPKAAIQNDFDYLKQAYRIYEAWEDLGLPGEPMESCQSPLRDDVTPSFSVFDGGRKWKDHGTEEHGDVFDFVQIATGFNAYHVLLWIKEQQNQRFNPFNNNNTDEHAS